MWCSRTWWQLLTVTAAGYWAVNSWWLWWLAKTPAWVLVRSSTDADRIESYIGPSTWVTRYDATPTPLRLWLPHGCSFSHHSSGQVRGCVVHFSAHVIRCDDIHLTHRPPTDAHVFGFLRLACFHRVRSMEYDSLSHGTHFVFVIEVIEQSRFDATCM